MKKRLYIFIGGVANGDYDAIHRFAKRGGTARWSSLKTAEPGDRALMYVVSPYSALIAESEVLEKAVKGEPGEWAYLAKVGGFRLLPCPASLDVLKREFPDWGWLRCPRGKALVPERLADPLLRLVHAQSSENPQSQETGKRCWLYPISGRAGRRFALDDGSRLRVSLDTYRMLVEDGRLSQDERWALHINFRQARPGDEVFIYTGEGDVGIVGYAAVRAVDLEDRALILDFDIEKCKALLVTPVPAKVVRKWIPFPRAAVMNLSRFRADLYKRLPWGQERARGEKRRVRVTYGVSSGIHPEPGPDLKRILVEARLTPHERALITALCDKPDSAPGLVKRLGFTHFVEANQLLGSAARRVFEAASQDGTIRKWRSEGKGWYHVIATGKYEKDRHYCWYIRPEIRQALVDLGWNTISTYKTSGSTRPIPAEVLRRIIASARLSEQERRAVTALCGITASAKGLAEYLGLSGPLQAKKLVGGAGRKILDAAPQHPVILKWRSEDDYPIGVVVTLKRFENDKHLYWQIRPEVRQSFLDLGWYPSPGDGPTFDRDEFENRFSKLMRVKLTIPPPGQAKPATVATTSQAYARDPAVKAWVLQNAHGICEACGNPTPFIGDDGEPFLESHHVRLLAEGGSDTITNAVAVCPNCHRRCHVGADRKQFTNSLYVKIPRLVRE